jgi:predicted Co/Zn/Cd cation transporter (cation efflux family)
LSEERRILRLSAFACLGIGIVGATFAWLTGSEAILLDGAFNPTYFVTGLLTLEVVDWVERGDDERYPFGYGFFEPLVNGMKSLLVSGVSLMALFGAVSALLSGGRAIALGWAVVYGAVASASCWTLAWLTRLAMAELDAARARVGERLLAEDPNLVLDVIFTEDPRWFAVLPPAP